MKLLRAALAVAITLLVAGCLPVTSKTPVGTTAGLGADPALYGTWKGHGEDDKDKTDGYFHFLKSKDGTITILIVGPGTGQDAGNWMAFDARTAALEKNHFINVVETFDDNKPVDESLKDANIPLFYAIRGRRLTLYWLDEDKVKKAIQAGQIAGTIEPGDYGDVKLTADAAALDAFMAKPEAAKLFKVFMVLRKVE